MCNYASVIVRKWTWCNGDTIVLESAKKEDKVPAPEERRFELLIPAIVSGWSAWVQSIN